MNVLITGASAGIGLAAARAFGARGSSVTLIARRAGPLADAACTVEAAGGRALAVPADVADAEALSEAVERAREAFGPIDVLVNNAGMPGGGTLVETEAEVFERVMRVNYLAATRLTRLVLPEMLSRRRGAVVNVASVAGRVGVPGSSAYSASKFALAGFSEALSVEAAPHGVAVILVNPGPVHTEQWPHASLRNRRLVLEAEDVAEAIVRAVARGRSVEITLPRVYRIAPILGALAPPVYRAMMRAYARRRA